MYTFNLIKWCNWQSTNKLNGVIGRAQYIATNIFNFNNQIYTSFKTHDLLHYRDRNEVVWGKNNLHMILSQSQNLNLITRKCSRLHFLIIKFKLKAENYTQIILVSVQLVNEPSCAQWQNLPVGHL